MKEEIAHSLTDNSEACARQNEGGVEFWLAWGLQHLLGCSERRNFNALIKKEQIACEVSGHIPGDYFVDVNKMADHGAMSLISQDFFVPGVDFRLFAADNPDYIRPLAVRPLTNSEGVPTPWGFSISIADFALAGGSCHD